MEIQVTVLTPKGIVLETRTVPDDYFDTPEQPAAEDPLAELLEIVRILTGGADDELF